MEPRITDRNVLQRPIQALLGLSAPIATSSIEPRLQHLIKMRVSQINGCALCLAMHAKELLDDGERQDRLAVLDAWRETGWFTDRERAALAFAEAMTTLDNREVPDAVYDEARAQFSEQELGDLALVTIAINGWNRLNVAFRNQPTPFTIETKEAVAAD
jgi:AhpD family alkylhydroperoxidase